MPVAVDLFCGAGGLTVGLKQAGINVAAAVELDTLAANTYRANHPEVTLFDRDIRSVSGDDILDAVGQPIDILVGCPPCQGFSSLTFKNKNEDERNLLVLEFLRIAEELRPRVVMMENVPGLAKRGNHLFELVVNGLRSLNYNVNFDVLQVADYGVPQRRRRLVMIAALDIDIQLPKPRYARQQSKGRRPWKTLRNAIGHIQQVYRISEVNDIPNAYEKYSNVNWNVARDLSEINLARIRTIRAGETRYAIPEHLRPNCHKNNNGFANVYGRLSWDEPSVTITRGCTTLSMGRFGHPDQDRALSVREAAILQTFPRRYKFVANSIEKASILVGNAFPCLLARKLGRHIMSKLQ
jgi:DNA (cytosine-5)-methyltransferase 1